jgi:hypothetical protein
MRGRNAQNSTVYLWAWVGIGENGEKLFTGLFTCLLTGSRLFSTVLYEGKTNLRSDRSFVPNQALYQAEPQPVLPNLSRGPYFAYFNLNRKGHDRRLLWADESGAASGTG